MHRCSYSLYEDLAAGKNDWLHQAALVSTSYQTRTPRSSDANHDGQGAKGRLSADVLISSRWTFNGHA